MADGEGFEPSVPCGTHAFQACPIDRSGTHPMSGQDIEANRQVLQLNFRLLLVQGALQRVQLSLEFTLSFLDNLQLQLITMQLNRCVVDVASHLGCLSLAFAKRSLQVALNQLQFIGGPTFKVKLLWRGIPGCLYRLRQLGGSCLQKMK